MAHPMISGAGGERHIDANREAYNAIIGNPATAFFFRTRASLVLNYGQI